MAVSVACMAIYWPTPRFKGRTFKLCVLNRWDFNFCIHSSPLWEKFKLLWTQQNKSVTGEPIMCMCVSWQPICVCMCVSWLPISVCVHVCVFTANLCECTCVSRLPMCVCMCVFWLPIYVCVCVFLDGQFVCVCVCVQCVFWLQGWPVF